MENGEKLSKTEKRGRGRGKREGGPKAPFPERLADGRRP